MNRQIESSLNKRRRNWWQPLAPHDLQEMIGAFLPRLRNCMPVQVRLLVLLWIAWILCPVSLRGESSGAGADESRAHFEQQIRGLLETFCFDCHANGSREGNFAFDQLANTKDPSTQHVRWQTVWQNVRSEIMPPSDANQPSLQERRQIMRWIEDYVFKLDPDQPDPGHVVIRRLNREEYRNTVLDLLDVQYNTTENFPPDDTGYGFDTIGEVLSLSPLLLEKYLRAARVIATEAIPLERPTTDSNPASEARYRRIFFAGPPPAEPSAQQEYLRTLLKGLASKAFRRPVPDSTLDRLVRLAVEAQDLHHASFEEAVAHATMAILTSPHFLFRAETWSTPTSSPQVVPLDDFALASRLSYFLWSSLPDDRLTQLATQGQLRTHLVKEVDRMLTDKRSQRFVHNFVGQWLQTRDVVGKHINVKRALNEAESDLELRLVDRARPAMRLETEMLFGHIVKENRSLDELLLADYSFLNDKLARLYGIAGVEGAQMRKVDLPDGSHRGGLLTHASLLLVTSNPQRTSPVKRGLFILDNFLGTPTAPAPPNVPELEQAKHDGNQDATMRQLMHLHRKSALCASCHARMDPLGLALENYNTVGIYRDTVSGQPVDTAGKLITGERFETAQELAQIIVCQRRRDFYRCVAEKMLVFAIGRGVEYYDGQAVEQIVDRLESEQGKVRTLIHAVVQTAAFQKRRG